MKGIVTAIRTLSSLPIPGREARRFSDALVWFPAVGFLLGGIVYLTAVLLSSTFWMDWPEGVAIVCIGLSVLITGGLHLDGVADWADGFWGGNSPQRVLTIMKDTHLGAFGTIALVLILLSKWVAVVKMIELHRLEWIVAAYIVSRAMQVELAVCLPYARREGTAFSYLANANGLHRLTAHILALGVLAILYNFTGLLCFFLAAILIRGFGKWCLKRAGGVTGDLLGAGSELVEVFVLFFSVSVPSELLRYHLFFAGFLQSS